MVKSNLILSGGAGHEFEITSAYLADLLKPLGVSSKVTDDWTGWTGEFDLVTVNGLRCRLPPDHYEPLRGAHLFATPWTLTHALEQHLARGGAILAMHSAILSMDDWPGWASMCGAAWDWDRSFHPPPGDVYCRYGRQPFTVTDECFHLVRMHGEMEILLTARVNWNRSVLLEPPAGVSSLGLHQPMMWVRRHGGGRVGVDLLGHDERSLESEDHQRVLYDLVSRLLELQ